VTDLITPILAASLPLSMPILFASVGEVYAERAGILNLGIEGIMGLSAFVSLWVTYSTGSYLYGLLAAIVAAGLMGLLYSYASVRIGTNQLITGLLIYTLSLGIADFSYRRLTSVSFPLIQPLPPISIPGLSDLPVVGPVLFHQNVMVYASLAVAIVMGAVLYRTTWGLKIRAVGENPEASDAAGINVNMVRQLCVLFGAMMAGVGGASLTLGYLGLYNSGGLLVAGRGWIALVVVIFSRWSPYRAVAGSWVFGLGYSIAATSIGSGLVAGAAQGTEYFLLMIPYVFALAFVFVFHRGTKPPSSLTVPYKRK